MAMNGSDVLLLVNTGTDAAPVWTAVGSQRNVEFPESVEPVDVSSKDSPNRRVIGGRYQASVTLESLYVPSDLAFIKLKTACRSRQLIKIRRQEAGTDIEEASALITELSPSFPDQAEATVSISLEIDGAWQAV